MVNYANKSGSPRTTGKYQSKTKSPRTPTPPKGRGQRSFSPLQKKFPARAGVNRDPTGWGSGPESFGGTGKVGAPGGQGTIKHSARPPMKPKMRGK